MIENKYMFFHYYYRVNMYPTKKFSFLNDKIYNIVENINVFLKKNTIYNSYIHYNLINSCVIYDVKLLKNNANCISLIKSKKRFKELQFIVLNHKMLNSDNVKFLTGKVLLAYENRLKQMK